MSNEASESLRLHIHAFKINSLGLVAQRNDGEYSQAEYIEESADLGEKFLDSINAIIRTEKLKLLAEVRERVVGENEPEFNTPKPEVGNMARNRLREAQTDLLAKLEAEL